MRALFRRRKLPRQGSLHLIGTEGVQAQAGTLYNALILPEPQASNLGKASPSLLPTGLFLWPCSTVCFIFLIIDFILFLCRSLYVCVSHARGVWKRQWS